MNVKMYKDGDRLLIRLDEYDEQTLKNLENILQVSCEYLKGLTPPEKIKEIKKRAEEPVKKSMNDKIINPYIRNMPNFNLSCQRWIKKKGKEDYDYLCKFMNGLRNIAPETLPDDDMCFFLTESYKGTFQKKLENFMQKQGVASLNVLFQSGRLIMDEAYRFCIS